MKTSHILLAIIAVVTLTGMVATNVLLKRQYDKIDWNDQYQSFERHALPSAKHWVIEGTPTDEIIIERSTDTAQALVNYERSQFFRVRQRGDTAYITFTPNFDGIHEPKSDADNRLGVDLVLRLPDV